MDDSARVLSRAAGPIDARMMFIGEAPGRLGADASEIPFHGDTAGHNFEELLAFAGLHRADVFVTNAVLCNPKAGNGNNATPNQQEIKNCSSYLKEQIDLVNPKVVVTLGSVALQAVMAIEAHELALSRNVRTANRWYKRLLIPLYHPGSRAMIHRSMANQRSDYQFVAEQLNRLSKSPRRVSGKTRSGVAQLARAIIAARGSTSYFALHKLVYLVEWQAWATRGEALTGAFFIRQKDGPYCTDLHLAKLRKALPDLKVAGGTDRPMLRLAPSDLFHGDETGQLPAEERELITRVISETQGLSDAELKTKVYMSAPMRALMRAERTQLINLYNAPISFSSVIAKGAAG